MKVPFKEDFLQFVWMHRYFDFKNLRTTTGESIEIIHQGYLNRDEGPDFLQAKIKIGDILWNGSVEIHISSMGWQQHAHGKHQAYNNVVLHVVYETDTNAVVARPDLSPIPTLALKDRISWELIQKGMYLFENLAAIPCEAYLHDIESAIIASAIDRASVHRLERKSAELQAELKLVNFDWEELAYKTVAKYMGMKVNNDAFARLTTLMPYKYLIKQENVFQIEALLYGQAGLLEHNPKDEYQQQLLKEYQFQKHKFSLPEPMGMHEWKHLRLRPANFPEMRIAELAAMVSLRKSLFSGMIEATHIQDFHSLFKAEVSAYWQHHFRFGKSHAQKHKGIGSMALASLIINVVIPLTFAYASYKGDSFLKDKAFSLLEKLPFENNAITRLWAEKDICAQNGLESQALIELFNNFCSLKKCLQCPIGAHILRRDK